MSDFTLAANSGLYSGLASPSGALYSAADFGLNAPPTTKLSPTFSNRADAEEVVPHAVQVGVSVRHARRRPGGCAGILGGFRGVVGLRRGAHGRGQNDRGERGRVSVR